MPDKVQPQAASARAEALANVAAQAALTTHALAAIRLFGGDNLDRFEASELLDLWRNRADLGVTAVNQVLAQFPVPGGRQ